MSKKTTMQIAVETMERIATNNKTDNNINHLAMYISDTIAHNNNKLTKTVKAQIETPIVYLAINIVKSRLKQIQLRSNRTYNEYNWKVINSLSTLYNTTKINPYNLYFVGLVNPVKSDRNDNNNKLYNASDYNSYNICCDMVSECVCNIYTAITTMINNKYPVDLLTPYIIPYDTTDNDGIEKPVKKWKYKAVNVIRICADAVEKIFADYKSTVLLDDVLTDNTGTVKVLPLSAVSDTVGSVTITDDIISLFDNWIMNFDISDKNAEILKLHYLYKMTVEQLSEKYDITPKAIEQAIARSKEKIASGLNLATPDKITKANSGKKIIVLYNSFGKKECCYTSVSKCAKALNVSRTAIQKALKLPKIATCKGYTMDYVTI